METIQNTYLIKALAAYPYELEEAVESLNYALSYDANNVQALCLMGRIYSDHLRDVATAKEYYAAAMASNMEYAALYPAYARVLIINDDFDEVKKLIDFGLTIKGADKAALHLVQGQAYEAQGLYEQAKASFKTAKQEGLNNDFISFVENELARVKKKMSKKKKSKKSRKKKK